jgi:hypothetical protein
VQSAQTYAGTFAAASGTITHGQTSTLQLVVDCTVGGVSFLCRGDTESGRDFIRFYIDGMQWMSRSGAWHWQTMSFPVMTAGRHTFTWTYSRDAAGGSGSDRVWVDQVEISGAPPPPAVWFGDTGSALGSSEAGREERLVVVTAEDAAGTPYHAGYFAVMNHRPDGNDPREFLPMRLHPVPVPEVSPQAGFLSVVVNWANATADAGEGAVANVAGYDVYRSGDGIHFTRANDEVITGQAYTDTLPYAVECIYALSPVFRGTPPVRGQMLSANSFRYPMVTADSDADGIPDWWTVRYFGHPTGQAADRSRAQDDASGSGQSNLTKYLAALDPKDPMSVFAIRAVAEPPARGVAVGPTSPLRLYSLERQFDLSSGQWAEVPGVARTPGAGNNLWLHDTDRSESTFYRVVVGR